jgi:hypothetical protein
LIRPSTSAVWALANEDVDPRVKPGGGGRKSGA